MRPAMSLEAFVADPVGTWIYLGTSVLWCASPRLAGSTSWGAPDATQTQRVLEGFAALWAPSVDPPVDLVLDARGLTYIDGGAMNVLVDWCRGHLRDLRGRIGCQFGVIQEGLNGYTLSGILPILGETHSFQVVYDVSGAFRSVLGEGGDALCQEVTETVAQVMGGAAVLQQLRELLGRDCASPTLSSVARSMALSPRTLQRQLSLSQTSFAAELRDVRFRKAQELLLGREDKLHAVAATVGLGETALRNLFRVRLGCTPQDFRKRARGGGSTG